MPKAESSRAGQQQQRPTFNPFSLQGAEEDPEQTPERYARDLKVLARMKERERKMQPTSKSTARRQKRREKSALTADLGDVGEALDAMEEDQPGVLGQGHAVGEDNLDEEQQQQPKQGQTQKKGGKVTQSKRQRELEMAKSRLPQLLKHEQFKANPFAAIRQHTQNTMQ